MRRLLIILMLFLIPAAVLAQSANDVAHGSEKAAHEVAHPAESHGEGGEAPKTYFGMPGWVLKLVNMLLFLGLLGYFIAGPVRNAFNERTEVIRRQAEEARERRTKADAMAAEIQARLTGLESELRTIRERAEADGERQKRELIAAAEAEAAKIVQAARNEVDNRLKHAKSELTEYAGQLAAERAEEILRATVTEADQKKLFEQSVRDVAEVKS